MKDFNLSEHFTFYEMTDSHDHPELVEKNRIAACKDPEIISNLTKLCHLILEPIRAQFYAPLKVLSGFRCLALNTIENGSKNSQHMRGQAGDFTLNNIEAAWKLLSMGHFGITWHQEIWYPKHHFVHISLPTGQNDGQILVK
jgi:uncharacterized protein YcbK (DUF882 family)